MNAGFFRRRLLRDLAVATVGCLAARLPAPAPARADDVDDVIANLSGSRSLKVRAQAVAVLARLGDPRAFQAVGRAAVADPDPTVRIAAVRLLGKRGAANLQRAQQARLALTRALDDRDPKVRKQARAALAALDRATRRAAPPGPVAETPAAVSTSGPIVVAVGRMGDRTGRASQAQREQLRLTLRRLLQRLPHVSVTDVAGPSTHFVVDGTIGKLVFHPRTLDVEVECAVELLVSQPPRGIVTIASGEAVVMKPRRQFRDELLPRLEDEAMESAVAGAHQNLAVFLASQ